MEQTKIMVSGCHGKMGQIVCDLINKREDMEIFCGFDIATKDTTFPVFNTIEDLENSCIIPDVIIDFSKPDCTMNILENFAEPLRIPMVIATTGFSDEKEALEKIKLCAQNTLVFLSSNMSYTVSIFEQILRDLAPKLPGHDIEILEIHHNRKVDAPSGTAKSLAKAINAYLPKPREIVFNRDSKRNLNEIGISSLRCGGVVGTHTVIFATESETFELTHRASSREMFAEGALKAAEYLLKQKSNGISHGFFNMKNMM